MMVTERVKLLRQHALDQDVYGIRSQEGELLAARGWMESYESTSHIVRRAKAKAYMHAHATPVIDEGELIVGKPCYRPLAPYEEEELEQYRQGWSRAIARVEGQGSHMAIDYEKLLRLGVHGIQKQIQELRSDLQLENPRDMERDEFYKACLVALDGLLQYADHYADLAGEMAEQCSDEGRKRELLTIAKNCRRVPRYPAGSFYEALQSIHFVTFCLEGLYQLGRPDRYLIHYYRKDIQEGRLTPEFAQELVDCLCILFNEYIPKGLAVGFMVGGRDAIGRDVTNELTYHFVESIGHTRMIYPGIGLCYTRDTPEDLLLLASRWLEEGLSHPALFNDEVITRGLLSYGLPPAEACQYVHSTCVEITPIASSGVWVASPYINLVQLLLDLLGVPPLVSGEKAPSPTIYGAWEDLLEAYRSHLGEVIQKEAVKQNRMQMERYHHGGDPLVSCFVNDCLPRGRDIDQGGARYNWIMPSFVGLANLVDSFVAIRQLVFEAKELDMAEMAHVLETNFQGREDLRQKIMNRIPKYGNDIDGVDELVGMITKWVREETGRYRTWRGDRFVPSFFCWIMHEQLGSQTAASPDGRLAGFPFGDGSGPAQGREKKGPTASILSSTKWEHWPFIGGIAVNMKFSRKLFQEDSRRKMLDLIHTFMERGGFEIQINVVDRDTLLKARENPEAYKDLVVRVGGYSDYFVHLPAAMQEEVILRTTHEI